jgi:adenosylcobyric acid synthase
MTPVKRLTRVTGEHLASGAPVEGYEIHIGRTEGPDRARPMFRIGGEEEGAQSADGRVAGAYLHGLFAGDAFRRAYLAGLGVEGAGVAYAAGVEAALDALAAHLEAHLDLDGLLAVARARV